MKKITKVPKVDIQYVQWEGNNLGAIGALTNYKMSIDFMPRDLSMRVYDPDHSLMDLSKGDYLFRIKTDKKVRFSAIDKEIFDKIFICKGEQK